MLSPTELESGEGMWADVFFTQGNMTAEKRQVGRSCFKRVCLPDSRATL